MIREVIAVGKGQRPVAPRECTAKLTEISGPGLQRVKIGPHPCRIGPALFRSLPHGPVAIDQLSQRPFPPLAVRRPDPQATLPMCPYPATRAGFPQPALDAFARLYMLAVRNDEDSRIP